MYGGDPPMMVIEIDPSVHVWQVGRTTECAIVMAGVLEIAMLAAPVQSVKLLSVTLILYVPAQRFGMVRGEPVGLE
jgi:cation transporter-like permease